MPLMRSGGRYERPPPLATTHQARRVMTEYDNTKKLSGVPPGRCIHTHQERTNYV